MSVYKNYASHKHLLPQEAAQSKCGEQERGNLQSGGGGKPSSLLTSKTVGSKFLLF